jgi:hypothetical protein
LSTSKTNLVKVVGLPMQKGVVAAVLLAAIATGCADEPQPPVVQPSNHHAVPLPPVKPDLSRAAAQPWAFTDWLQMARYH